MNNQLSPSGEVPLFTKEMVLEAINVQVKDLWEMRKSETDTVQKNIYAAQIYSLRQLGYTLGIGIDVAEFINELAAMSVTMRDPIVAGDTPPAPVVQTSDHTAKIEPQYSPDGLLATVPEPVAAPETQPVSDLTGSDTMAEMEPPYNPDGLFCWFPFLDDACEDGDTFAVEKGGVLRRNGGYWAPQAVKVVQKRWAIYPKWKRRPGGKRETDWDGFCLVFDRDTCEVGVIEEACYKLAKKLEQRIQAKAKKSSM